MELPLAEFDLILGMDWLTKHKATLDCAAKRMVLRTVNDEAVNDYWRMKGLLIQCSIGVEG